MHRLQLGQLPGFEAVEAGRELTPRLKILLRIGVIRCREMFRCRREGREFVELKRK